MKFYMVLRQTEDWDKLDLDSYWASDKDRRFLCFAGHDDCRDVLDENLKKWERLRLNFFQYRHALKEMTMGRWYTDHISVSEALKIKDRNTIFLPIDDDDLVKPGLLEVLEEHFQDPDVEAVFWKTWCYSIVNGVERYCIEPGSHCFRTPSNCYAIRSSFAYEKLLMNHRFFADSEMNKVELEEAWGLRIIHPASMERNQKRTDMIASLRHIVRQDPPSDLSWGVDLMNEVYELTSSLNHFKVML